MTNKSVGLGSRWKNTTGWKWRMSHKPASVWKPSDAEHWALGWWRPCGWGTLCRTFCRSCWILNEIERERCETISSSQLYHTWRSWRRLKASVSSDLAGCRVLPRPWRWRTRRPETRNSGSCREIDLFQHEQINETTNNTRQKKNRIGEGGIISSF